MAATTLPAVSDAATIWCDEERWQVLRRADQLGLDLPPSNPTGQELGKRYTPLLPTTPRSEWEQEAPEKVAGWLRILDEWVAESQKYETGEWDLRGVTDDDWDDWVKQHPEAYTRSCAAAYELAGAGGEIDSTPPTTEWVDEATDATTTTSESSTSEATTTSTAAPGRLVAGTVIACPDFIEATFRNTGGKAVSIVEIILFIEGIDEQPFGYGTGWTPTIESGEAATWRTTAADLGLDWIGPGLVSVGARPHTSTGEFVYADGPNPHVSCTAVAPSTTTTEPPRVDGIEVTGSRAACSADGATFTFKIVNTGTNDLRLDQVALFPYVDDSHHFFEPENWWPLPVVPPGEAVTHTEDFFFGEFWTGDSIELFVVSSSGQTIVDIPCS